MVCPELNGTCSAPGSSLPVEIYGRGCQAAALNFSDGSVYALSKQIVALASYR